MAFGEQNTRERELSARIEELSFQVGILQTEIDCLRGMLIKQNIQIYQLQIAELTARIAAQHTQPPLPPAAPMPAAASSPSQRMGRRV